jgi:hypothetical protein
VVADERAELAQARVERLAVDRHHDVASERFEIGEDHTRADVRFVAEDGIADVIEMRCDRVVEEQRVLELGGIADGAVIADEHVLTDVGVVADLTIAPDDGRAFDHRAIFDNGPFPDENILADVGDPFAGVREAGFNMGFDVVLDLFERVPGVGAAVEKGGVFRLAQVKQIGGFEHDGKLGEREGGANIFLASVGEWNRFSFFITLLNCGHGQESCFKISRCFFTTSPIPYPYRSHHYWSNFE